MIAGHHARLTDPVKRLLAFIREDGEVVERAGYWHSKWNGIRIHQNTIDAAYDRCLIYIVTDSRHRKRHAAKLTEIGKHVASDIYRTEINRDMRVGEVGTVSEGAQKLITELVDAA
jgi:hypothetical protein